MFGPTPFVAQQSVQRKAACLLCQHPTGQLLSKINYIGLAQSDLVFCPECGHIGLDPIPDAQTTARGCALLYALEQQRESSQRIRRGFMRSYRRGGRFARKYLASHFDKNRPLNILEIGAGDGYFSQGIKSHFNKAHVTYVDIVPELIAYYRQHFTGSTAVAGEFKKELFQGHTFDLILFRDLLEHVLNPLEFLCDVRALLSDDGLGFFITPNGMEDAWPSYQYYMHKHLPYVIYLNHFHFFLPQTLDRLLEQSGLKKKLGFKFGLKGHRLGMGHQKMPQIDCPPAPDEKSAGKGPKLTELWKHDPQKIKKPLLHNNGPLSKVYSFFADQEKEQVDYYAPHGHEFFVLVEKTSS